MPWGLRVELLRMNLSLQQPQQLLQSCLPSGPAIDCRGNCIR